MCPDADDPRVDTAAGAVSNLKAPDSGPGAGTRSNAGSWHMVAVEATAQPKAGVAEERGGLPESEVSDAALILRDPVIRTNYRTAAIATRSRRR